MRHIEVGSDKFEYAEGFFSLVRDGVVETISADLVEVGETAATVFFRESRTFISMSLREWEYLRGLVDSIEEAPVAEEPVAEEPVAEEATPVVPSTRRGRRRA